MDIVFDPNKVDFGLELSLGPRTENPADMFQSLAGLIRAFDEIDREFAHSIDAALDPRLVLQTLEVGSLRTWFISVLRAVPDEALKELDWKKVIGALLVKAKYRTIRWLEGKNTITNAGEIEELRKEITQLKNEVERLRRLPVETPLPLSVVVTAVKKVSLALMPLPSGQSIAFVTSEGSLEINRSFAVTDEQIEEILTHTFKTERTRMQLTVKKPDLLGASMWDVVAQGHAVKAKIVDEQWLELFHERHIALLPGDALSADVRIDAHFDEEGQVFETKYTVEKVHGVEKTSGEQLELFRTDGDEAHSDEETKD
jgi:hypothetical protein